MIEKDLKKTHLHETHLSLNARTNEFGGYLMPIQYEGIIKEHNAAREGAVLFDTCHMGEFRISGDSALIDLENIVTCDVASMVEGQCRYGLMCNEDGGVIDDLLVYRMAENDFMLVVNAGTQANDYEWIKSHLSPSTKLKNISAETVKIDLQGPKSPCIMQKLVDEPIADLKFYYFKKNKYQGKEVIVSRTGYTGEIGFEIYCDAEQGRSFWKAAMDLGAVPAGLGCRDTLRLEMGMPLYGHEMDNKRNAGESGFKRAVSAQKTFIGSKIILDPDEMESILIGIEFEGRRAARHGDIICDDSGQEVGIITSGSFSPSLQKAIALGYVKKSLKKVGTKVIVKTSRRDLEGCVASLPFNENGTARKNIKDFLNDC